MKQKIILLVALLSIVLTGCSKSKEISLVEQGKVALEKHEYSEAMEFLSQALEVDSSDEDARSMYMQAMRMENANEYKEQGNYKRGIEELEYIEKIKHGSSAIKSEALELKKELETLYEEHKKEQEERKENAKLTANKDKYNVEKDALNSNIREEKKEESVEEKSEESTPESKPEIKPESKPDTEAPKPPVQETPPAQDTPQVPEV